MQITLGERTGETVRVGFERMHTDAIRATLPLKAQSVEEALADYRRTLLPGAASFGRTVRADGTYVGDVWCYCIDPNGTPNAMLSFCIFEPELWNRGIATEAVALFLKEAAARYAPATVGAFTYADNAASLRVLEKNGFVRCEEFSEDGRVSVYLQRTF